MSNLIESEPSFRRSRSLAVPFLRSRFVDRDTGDGRPPHPSKSSFWSVFKSQKSKKLEGGEKKLLEGGEKKGDEIDEIDDEAKKTMMMMRSKSVGISLMSGGGEVRSSSKGKGWYFPSPIKVFRQSKASKVVQERSPLCRG